MLKPIIGCSISLEGWHGMQSVMQMEGGVRSCRLSIVLYAYVAGMVDDDRLVLCTNTTPPGTVQTLYLPYRKHHSPTSTNSLLYHRIETRGARRDTITTLCRYRNYRQDHLSIDQIPRSSGIENKNIDQDVIRIPIVGNGILAIVS